MSFRLITPRDQAILDRNPEIGLLQKEGDVSFYVMINSAETHSKDPAKLEMILVEEKVSALSQESVRR